METLKTDNFVEDKPTRAAERGYLPYMEMKSSFSHNTEKEETELPGKTPSQPKRNKEEGFGLSLQLGEEYERKKQKLKEELRQDYRRYVSEKKNVSEPAPQLQASTFKMQERSTNEKLQDERIKDYSVLLRAQEELEKMRKTSNEPQSQTPGRDLYVSTTPYHSSLSLKSHQQKSPERPLSSRRDAGTATEPLLKTHTRAHRRREETPERWHSRPRRHREHYSSEEELNLDEEEQEEFELLHKRRPRHRAEPAHAGRRERRLQHRVAQERREVDVHTVNEGEYLEDNRPTPQATLPVNPPAPVQIRAINKNNMGDFATGLMIGANEQGEATQRRKERYRQELLKQIEEQQRNKRKEKELELRVAATGAVDPEKAPDRIKQFGAVRREHEGRRRDTPHRPGMALGAPGTDTDRRPREVEREPPERPRVAFQSPIMEYSSALGHLGHTAGAGLWVSGDAPFSEDLRKGLAGTLGEMVAPRVTGIPPPPAPALSELYSTPYDEAYYYYGARNPLDPNLTYYGASVGAVPSLPNLPAGTHSSVRQPPALVLAQSALQHGISPSLGSFPSDRLQHPKENVLGYKDALKQQEVLRQGWLQLFDKIEERQERRRREREDRERYEAKLEAEMKAYEPWGRGGAGAPLKDERGNLISDLKRMHRSNEEAYMNPESRNNRRVVASTDKTLPTPRVENKESSRTSAGLISSFTRPSPHARGNVFTEQPTPQQILEQEKYKESLKRQIEEKRTLEAERRENLRLEEEREEKRLAEERARIQKQYEEEQEKEKRKETEQNNKNQELIRLLEERRQEAERKRKEEEMKESEHLKQQYEQERQARLEQDFRSESPPIPTVQKRLGSQNPPRPPSVESQRSVAVLSACSVPTPRSPPVPARRNQIRAAEDQQGVISELSLLRRRLRSEQRRLEGQLEESDREDTQTPLKNRERPLLDVFDMARLRMQVPARRPPSNTRAVNKQNMQDFNQLKYRDSESREQVRQAYPEPPTDEDSLEIQQQALLREQQRRLNSMRRAKTDDYFDLSSPMKPAYQRRKNFTEEAERRSLLQSESAFIDPCGYSFPETPQPERSPARERRRRARRQDEENTPGSERIRQFLGSANSFHLDRVQEQNQRRMRALDDMSEHHWRSGEISADEDDDLWQQTRSPLASRRVSTTTFTTEPWLRPGTSETFKKPMAGRRPPSTGPSTYHG
ncbi:centrosome and spindle pole-associated protein 1 isoform X3 [Trichomycterus rosablanca]|uniref:centrosome and spindle pole-associated protein 1 isoform X3 n=1 Tax=Trichomycterus rosablanca TaxID=2290929 RepID=UPI002F359812